MGEQKDKQLYEINCSQAETIIYTNFGMTGGNAKKQIPTNELVFLYENYNYTYRKEGVISIENPFEAQPSRDGYVLKIMNSLCSKMEEFVEAENVLMLHLREKGIKTTYPVTTVRGDYYAKIKLPLTPFEGNRNTHIVRLFVRVPGTNLRGLTVKLSFLYKMGELLGNVTEALKGISHPFPKTHTSIWHLESVPLIKSMTNVIENLQKRVVVDDVIDKFIRIVLPHADDFEKGIIYSEFNGRNIEFTNTDESPAIVGMGDVHMSNDVFQLVYALCNMMLECERSSVDPVAGAGQFMAGYKSFRPSFFLDVGKIKISICARLCQGLVLGLRESTVKQSSYFVLNCEKYGWSVLENLWEMSDERLARVWNRMISLRNKKL